MTSPDACRRVREELWQGRWDHRHLAGCDACRRRADRLAALDDALYRGPEEESAPPGLVGAVRARIALEEEARSRRFLLAAAVLTGLVTVVVAWSGMPLLAGLDPLESVPSPASLRPETLLAALQEGMTRPGGAVALLSGALYALAAAALVGLLAHET